MFRILLLLTCSLVIACSSPAPRDDARVRAEIAHTLDAWHAAAARADEAAYFAHLASDAVFLGTDATERWSTPAFRNYAHPHFARGKAWSFRSTRRAIILAQGAEIAWFDEDLHTEGLGPARGGGVLVRRDGRWLITHYNLAITVPNDRFNEVKTLLANARTD